jgi:hypothetical protein
MAAIPPASAVAPALARAPLVAPESARAPLGPHRWGQPSTRAAQLIAHTKIGASVTTRERLTAFLDLIGARSTIGID